MTPTEPLLPRRALLLGSSLLPIAACTTDTRVGPSAIEGQRPSGTIEMEMVQAAYIGSGGGGRGTLHFRGRHYPFTVAGAGIGGIGVSAVQAHGEVYFLNDVARFPGAYAQARYGFALGARSAGELWLQNEAGVIMRLKARREGLMLSLGGDAVVIALQ